MSKIRLLLSAAEAGATLGLFLVVFLVGALVGDAGTLGLVLGDAVLLRLLIGRSLGIGLGLDFGGLLGLFALYFGIFGGVPRVDNLRWSS